MFFFWNTLRPLRLKMIISYSRGRTLSGHTWSTARKFSILNLSSLHPYGKLCLGYAARLRFMLLENSTRCLATAHNCSATQHSGRTMSSTAHLCSHLLGQAQDGVTQRVHGAWGLAMGCMTMDTHGRPHGLRPQGRPTHKMNPFGARLCLVPPARHRKDT